LDTEGFTTVLMVNKSTVVAISITKTLILYFIHKFQSNVNLKKNIDLK